MVKILTDTSTDLSLDWCKEHDVRVLPLTISIGDESFKDKFEITPDEFYEKMKASKIIPKTSQVTTGQFKEAFEEMLVEAADQVLVITLANALSGTHNSACVASEEVDSKRIFVFDGSVTVLNNVLVEKAVMMAKEGASVEEITKELEIIRDKQQVLFILDSLEYLQKGGRISTMSSIVGGLLNVKPILTLNEERKIEFFDKAKGEKKSTKLMLDYVFKGRNKENPLMMVYGGKDALPRLLEIQKILEEELGEKVESIVNLAPVIGSHTGPGVIAVVY